MLIQYGFIVLTSSIIFLVEFLSHHTMTFRSSFLLVLMKISNSLATLHGNCATVSYLSDRPFKFKTSAKNDHYLGCITKVETQTKCRKASKPGKKG